MSQKGGVHSDKEEMRRYDFFFFFGVDCILGGDMCYVLMM